MVKEIEFSANSEINEHALESKKMDLSAGWLGKFFGSSQNASSNICGLLVLSLLVIGSVVSVFSVQISPIDYWKMASQMIIPCLAYLFGKSSKA